MNNELKQLASGFVIFNTITEQKPLKTRHNTIIDSNGLGEYPDIWEYPVHDINFQMTETFDTNIIAIDFKISIHFKKEHSLAGYKVEYKNDNQALVYISMPLGTFGKVEKEYFLLPIKKYENNKTLYMYCNVCNIVGNKGELLHYTILIDK